MSQDVFFNGINGSTGLPFDDSRLTTELLAKIACQKQLDGFDKRNIKLRYISNQRNLFDFGVINSINIAELSECGWGVIFPATLHKNRVAALKDALGPLLTLRRQQATRKNPGFYKEFIGPQMGYQTGESKNDFFKRFGCGPGSANPETGIPFYLLIVGSPEEIPFSFQHQLDLAYGVGRIYFDKSESYAMYAQSVVAAENKQIMRSKSAAFFGVSHDRATILSTNHLVKPLAKKITAKHSDWAVNVIDPDKATKSTLSDLFGGSKTPAFLFTACHGMGFDLDDPRLLPHTGSLLCQDIINYAHGNHPVGLIPDRFYFSADDISPNANVFGMIAFFFACFGAGSPHTDNFSHLAKGKQKIIAPYPFLSQLPLKLLSHPKGSALGVFAHVDRALSCSFEWDKDCAVDDHETFRSMISDLLDGLPAGAATDSFGARYADVATMLGEELDKTPGAHQDESKLAWLWASKNDSRNYSFIGDPAVRLVI